MGWTYRQSAAAWELTNAAGIVVRRVGDEFLARFGADQLNRYGARQGWPELSPECGPWIACLAVDGPAAGGWQYFAPAGQPPERLTWWRGADDKAETVTAAGYARQVQPCGHGRCCPYPYRHDRGLW